MDAKRDHNPVRMKRSIKNRVYDLYSDPPSLTIPPTTSPPATLPFHTSPHHPKTMHHPAQPLPPSTASYNYRHRPHAPPQLQVSRVVDPMRWQDGISFFVGRHGDGMAMSREHAFGRGGGGEGVVGLGAGKDGVEEYGKGKGVGNTRPMYELAGRMVFALRNARSGCELSHGCIALPVFLFRIDFSFRCRSRYDCIQKHTAPFWNPTAL